MATSQQGAAVCSSKTRHVLSKSGRRRWWPGSITRTPTLRLWRGEEGLNHWAGMKKKVYVVQNHNPPPLPPHRTDGGRRRWCRRVWELPTWKSCSWRADQVAVRTGSSDLDRILCGGQSGEREGGRESTCTFANWTGGAEGGGGKGLYHLWEGHQRPSTHTPSAKSLLADNVKDELTTSQASFPNKNEDVGWVWACNSRLGGIPTWDTPDLPTSPPKGEFGEILNIN